MKKTILLTFFIAILILFAASSFYKFAFLHEYMVTIAIPCDVTTHTCFLDLSECDDESSEGCTHAYAYVTAPADTFTTCTPDDGLCAHSVCEESGSCAYEYCLDAEEYECSASTN